MDNQNIATQRNVQISIMDRVNYANKLINQIYALVADAEKMRTSAKNEEKAVKNAKKGRAVIRILSPFFHFLSRCLFCQCSLCLA